MSLNLNKPKATGVEIANPITRVDSVYFNHDQAGTISVTISFFETEQDMADNRSFTTETYNLSEPAGLQKQVEGIIKLNIPEFDQAN